MIFLWVLHIVIKSIDGFIDFLSIDLIYTSMD